MDPAATGAEPRETRMLAAIVFTDVVGFSRLAAQNEARVYVALQRDMGVITNLCRAHGGQVLNTMGDGMLLCFMSAVDAMTCAVEIQRTFFNHAASLPATDVLHHRIGVHLGDVIMNGDNVFGDGVNVAARLQAAAKPGGICFSQTVHDVVKNKLNLDEAKPLGNQQLKNLGTPVKVWQVPPLVEQNKPVMLDDLPKPVDELNAGASGFKAVVMVLACLVLVGGVVGFFMNMKVPKGAPRTTRKAPPKTTDVPPKTASTTGSPSTVPTGPSAAQVTADIERLRKELDFAGIVDVLARAGRAAPETETAKLATYTELAKLMDYLNGQMSQASISAPLRFDGVVGGQPTTLELSGQAPNMQVKVNGQYAPITWGGLEPANVVAAARSLSENQIHNSGPAPAEVKGWADLLAQEFGL
ncbi:MAG: adenylate/guanylate cyclase domain-containing protein [Fimbriimonas sp.]